MSKLPDHAARLAALTAIDRSLLVEAGAGSGKTALLAGRVAVLLANAIAPKHIAAITFTEFAASELLTRIDAFTQALATGGMPREIAQAFPRGLSAEQRASIERARNTLDQLTCTTIHGFAQALIKPYPAEAGIDPGAEIVDPAEADIAFDERYEAWLRAQLSGQNSGGIVAELVLAGQGGGLNLVCEVARFLRHNRDARPAGARWSRETVTRFVTAVRQFKNALDRLKFREQQTETTCRAFIDLAKALDKPSLTNAEPTNRGLLQAMDFPKHETCFTQSGTRRTLQTLGKWREAARIAGRSKAEGERAHDGLNARYETCHDALDEVMSAIAGELLGRLAEEMQSLMTQWRDYKRAAGLLDFDDLLHTARDLLARHQEVRQALAKRYRHVLVDEFQDTDPLQTEILWLLCGEKQKGSDQDPLARALRPGALFLVGDPKQAIYRFRGADVNAYIGARSAIGKAALLEITANFRSGESILRFVNERFKSALSPAAG